MTARRPSSYPGAGVGEGVTGGEGIEPLSGGGREPSARRLIVVSWYT